MDVSKLLAKNLKRIIRTQIKAESINSQDIGMNLGLKNVPYQLIEAENYKWRM